MINSEIKELLEKYIENIKDVYGLHLRSVILYGSYARGDYNEDSDIDIMILLDISNMDIENYRHQLSYMTYDFNMNFDVDIKPIAKDEQHFKKWLNAYPFYANIEKEGIKIYEAA